MQIAAIVLTVLYGDARLCSAVTRGIDTEHPGSMSTRVTCVQYTQSMEFEWDPKKAAANAEEHGVDFTEAMTVFGDPLEVTIADPDHSDDEQRFLGVGTSTAGRLLVVAYTERAGRTRIITAREPSSQERKDYESTNPSRR